MIDSLLKNVRASSLPEVSILISLEKRAFRFSNGDCYFYEKISADWGNPSEDWGLWNQPSIVRE